MYNVQFSQVLLLCLPITVPFFSSALYTLTQLHRGAEKHSHSHTHIRTVRMLSRPTKSQWDKPCQFTAWQLVNVVWLLWEQRMHCRNSKLHVINQIPAITPWNVYCILLSAVRETHEELGKDPTQRPRSPDCGAEQVKRVCFSHVHLQGLYNIVLGASYNNAVITRLESWGWLRRGLTKSKHKKLQRCSKMHFIF